MNLALIITTTCAVIVALLLGVAWMRARRQLAVGEQLWRNALGALTIHDYEGARTLMSMMENNKDAAALVESLRRSVDALEASEKAQERARRELEDVLASLQDAVLMVDGETRLRFLNSAAVQMFGVRVEDVLGAQLLEALPSFGIESAVRAALQEGKNSARDMNLYTNQVREIFLRVAPVRRSNGQVSGAVAILQDLTEMRRLERVRRDFVANASHELRTPIANIRATAETIRDAPDDPTLATRFLPHLVAEAERLSHLVTDLLDLARAEAPAETSRAVVDMRGVTSHVIQLLEDKAQQHNISINLEGEESARVLGDAAALEQVVFNLLDNAISYTPAGGHISLCVATTHADVPILQYQENGSNRPQMMSMVASNNGHSEGSDALSSDHGAVLTLQRNEHHSSTLVMVSVTDTGIGIPPDDLPRIFERFYRVDKARSRAQGGTGLGLAIVKHIVENHGGHVKVESEIGAGSTFTMMLPAA